MPRKKPKKSAEKKAKEAKARRRQLKIAQTISDPGPHVLEKLLTDQKYKSCTTLYVVRQPPSSSATAARESAPQHSQHHSVSTGTQSTQKAEISRRFNCSGPLPDSRHLVPLQQKTTAVPRARRKTQVPQKQNTGTSQIVLQSGLTSRKDEPSLLSSSPQSADFELVSCTRASLHQGHPSFGVNAGKQCSCNSLAFLLHSLLTQHFDVRLANRILQDGMSLYTGIGKTSYLLVTELPASVHLAGKDLDIKYLSPFTGNAFATSTDPNAPFLTLKHALQYVFRLLSRALMTFGRCPGSTSAIFRKDRFYWVFDPHSRDANGLPTSNGTAVILKFRDQVAVLQYLSKYARALVGTADCCPFEITPIYVTKACHTVVQPSKPQPVEISHAYETSAKAPEGNSKGFHAPTPQSEIRSFPSQGDTHPVSSISASDNSQTSNCQSLLTKSKNKSQPVKTSHTYEVSAKAPEGNSKGFLSPTLQNEIRLLSSQGDIYPVPLTSTSNNSYQTSKSQSLLTKSKNKSQPVKTLHTYEVSAKAAGGNSTEFLSPTLQNEIRLFSSLGDTHPVPSTSTSNNSYQTSKSQSLLRKSKNEGRRKLQNTNVSFKHKDKADPNLRGGKSLLNAGKNAKSQTLHNSKQNKLVRKVVSMRRIVVLPPEESQREKVILGRKTEIAIARKRILDALNKKRRRANPFYRQVENEQQRLRNKRKKKEQHAKQFSNFESPNNLYFRARNVQFIQIVEVNNIGPRLDCYSCPYCQALRWKDEPLSICCAAGTVLLSPFPESPDRLKNLWESNSVEAQLFRHHSRQLNNQLALSSQEVYEPDQPGCTSNPSVIIQGQVQQFVGPLQATPGKTAHFVELYVNDSDTQNDPGQISLADQLPQTLSDQEKQMLAQVLSAVKAELKDCNPYVHDFIHAFNVSNTSLATTDFVISSDVRPQNQLENCNIKDLKEISVFIPDRAGECDIVLRKQSDNLEAIADTHRSADPLHFVLLFPRGTDGWNLSLTSLTNGKPVTSRQFYSYHLQKRINCSDSLFRAERLFQEYCCVACAKTENQSLSSLRSDQPEVCAELDSFHDAIDANDFRASNVPEKRVVLASTFTGGPRDYHRRFQDAVATVCKYHQPDLLITFTCNLSWPELADALLPNQKPEDRPDLIARVFYLKLKSLLSDLANHVFGRVDAMMHVVDFEKGGLPRARILLILSEDDRLLTPGDIDSTISAEIPSTPHWKSAKRIQAERLQKTVFQTMIHGPCGSQNPKASCMKDAMCSEGFPKPFAAQSSWDNTLSSPTYRRQHYNNGGQQIRLKEKDSRMVDNSWVLPYNPYLTLTYNAQIIVEVGVSPVVVNSLFKYVTKGSDSATTWNEGTSTTNKDEIQDYQDGRTIGAIEACWRLFNFPLGEQKPCVETLTVHMPDQNVVVKEEGSDEATVLSTHSSKTPLTEFFAFNSQNPGANVSYNNFPQTYVWSDKELLWLPRENGADVIGRLPTIHPLSGDLFYLRMLLHTDQSKGATSFTFVRTVNGEVLETYKEACMQLGLIQTDNEWDLCLTDAAATKKCAQLRTLFVTLLLLCHPSNPSTLLERHFTEWYDDLMPELLNLPNPEMLRNLVLLDLEQQLQNVDKSLKDFALPKVNSAVTISHELNYDHVATSKLALDHSEKLSPSQRAAFDYVIAGVRKTWPVAVFIDGPGGTGKTFLLNTILASIRTIDRHKSIAIALASSEIAASLLRLGRTFDSLFSASSECTEDLNYRIPIQSDVAELIRRAKVIVWDEAPLAHRFLVETLDRSLRDIMQNDKLFGGKVIVLAGDFRQMLPVLQHSSRSQIVDAAINQSPLWKSFCVFNLKENVRNPLNGSQKRLVDFDNWVLSVGNGTSKTTDDAAIAEELDTIALPPKLSMPINVTTNSKKMKSLLMLFNWVFPDPPLNLNRDKYTHSWLAQRAILAPNENAVHRINIELLQNFPGEEIICYSADQVTEESDAARFTTEYLNTLDAPGMPPHALVLKPDVILILLCDLPPKSYLCSGTRLILQAVYKNRLMHCKIASGEHSGEDVFIPRTDFKPNGVDFPFSWQRRQFPVTLAFAMTIDQSRGQTFERIGVWLDQPVSSHGQLYMSASRVGSPDNLIFAVPADGSGIPNTKNVVYKEASSLNKDNCNRFV